MTVRLPLTDAGQAISRVLVVGCHSDDIEIGCGATLLALTRAQPHVEVTWVVLSAHGDRVDEAQSSAARFLAASAQCDVRVHDFRDGFFPYVGGEVKEVFESLKDAEPQVVLTHTRFDLHQDHRLVSELTWNTFRDQLILEYEVPKYDGDMSAPNAFVPLSERLSQRKIEHLMDHFASQRSKHWFREDLFSSLLRLRGMECNSPSSHAEAFYCRKAVLA